MKEMMPEQQFSPDESLQVIRSMIEKTRQTMSDKSQYFLVWGWGTFAACISQFILKVVFKNPYHSMVWFVIFICAFLTIIISKRDRKKEKVKTYIDESMGYLWAALGMAFFVISIVCTKIGWQYAFPFFIMLYGVGTFISGKVLRFPAFMIGGMINFALAAIAPWFEYDYQILFTAAAILVSYIIPGHLLRVQYQRNKQQRSVG